MYTPFSNESMYDNQEKPKKTCWVIHEFTSREMLGDTRCAPQCCFSVNCHSDFWLNAPVPAGAPWFPIPKQTMGDLFQYGFPMGFAMVSHFKTAWLPEDKVDLFQSSASGIRA
jgi:hypothetical protein